MASAFSIASSRFSDTSEDEIRAEIRSHTGSDEEVSSIMRSVERMGLDPTILRYEMTPTKSSRLRSAKGGWSWNVRAIR